MNADAFRHLYGYHFAQNRTLWDSCVTHLSPEQFTQAVNYSQGAVREQILHLIGVDEAWFTDLGATAVPESLSTADFSDLANIRAYWDAVEQTMRDYLAGLQDEMLSTKPLTGEDENLLLWQVLLHVANHGTDHRAQTLRLLNDLGVQTTSQDYIFYVYGTG